MRKHVDVSAIATEFEALPEAERQRQTREARKAAEEGRRLAATEARIRHDERRRTDPDVAKWGVPFGKGGGRHRKGR